MILKVPDSHRRDRLGVAGVKKVLLEERRRCWKEKALPSSTLGILNFREIFVLDLIWVCPSLIKFANFLIKPKKKKKDLIWVKLIWVKKKKLTWQDICPLMWQ